MTPQLVGLASRLQGAPFHLLATHCQRDTRENVVAYVKEEGLAADSPNMTVSSFGGHPKVKGNGYVPYYMVFDHHGDLVHHHMCGQWHGGDGLRMIELVDELLQAVPAVYLGKEPFTAVPRLAQQIGKLERLPAALAEIDKRLSGEPADAERGELGRLSAAIDDYRVRMLGQVEDLTASDPAAVLPHLHELRKQFAGTGHGVAIATRISELSKSKALADATRIDKSYRKTMQRLEQREPTARQLRAARKKLEKLIAGHDALPVTKKIRAAIEDLGR